ncbi:MAG: hypothetical protein FJX35_14305 [Alphaproteobacteria bacterium]|nr:hypothetical protein [Alphaproteobacteria bacterium]
MAVQTAGDVTGQYFTRGMFVFVPPLLLGFALWIKLSADKERATPVGRPAHLMYEGGQSPMMEDAMAEQDEKRRRENMPPELANLFGKGQQGGRR